MKFQQGSAENQNMKSLAFAALAAFLLASAAGAQSLGEIAKKEEARRKEIKKPSKVLTNEDLKKYGVPPPPGPDVKPQTAGTSQEATDKDLASKDSTAAKDAADAKAKGESSTTEPEKDEAWWRSKITEARAALDRNRLFLEALEGRANGLLAEFTARDDPAQRAVLATNREKVLAEIQKVRQEIVDQQKAVDAVLDEARQANVPPGWLR